MVDELIYYAVRPCGCLQGVAHVIPTIPSTRKSAANLVAKWVRDGYPVHSHTLAKEDLPDWNCEQHKEKTNG